MHAEDALPTPAPCRGVCVTMRSLLGFLRQDRAAREGERAALEAAPPTGRATLVFAVALAALWTLLVAQAWLAFPILDDWIQLGWYKDQPFGLELIWRVARYNHAHFNPRIGDVFLLLVNGPRVVHVVLTPLVQLWLLWVAFVVAFGRWPRRSYADLRALLILQLLIWLVSPLPGVLYFYRPFTTNYVFGFAITLSLIAPFRLAPMRGAQRAWAVVPMFALGWLAGMSNEHTGPAAIAALLVWSGVALRCRGLRAWMIAGTLGLVVGYGMLLTAPGQAERYAGRAAKFSPLELAVRRGLDGNAEIVGNMLSEAAWAIALVLVAVLIWQWRARRDAQARLVEGDARRAILGMLAGAGAIVGTLFASPVTIERLLFAPAVLIAGALTAVLAQVCARGSARLRAGIAIATVLILGYHAVRFVEVAVAARSEFGRRMARIAATPPGAIARVAPLRTTRSRWFWGDDFKMAAVREYVARAIFRLDAIEYDERPIWAEPRPDERLVVHRAYEPALASSDREPVLRYAPSFVDAALYQLHRGRALDGWGDVEGHALVRYDIDVASSSFRDPARRPLRMLTWQPTGVTFVDGDGYEDANGQPAIRIWRASLPRGWREAYLAGCGETQRIELVPDPDEPRALLAPLVFACRGTYSAAVCDASQCWLAGRFWR